MATPQTAPESPTHRRRVVLLLCALAALLALGGVLARTARTASPHSSAADTAAPATSPPQSGVHSLGERIAVRPGVYATPTARTVNLPAGQTGARADYVEVTIVYENHAPEPLHGMGALAALPGAADLDGQVFTMSF